MEQHQRADVAVVGGGAAGLMAAIFAAERGRRVILLEKNKRPGVKILMSGGTRCNVTNARPVREIARAFGHAARFLGSPLKAFDNEAAIRFFEEGGCPVHQEDDIVYGKIFPDTQKATDVLAALLRRLETSGALLRCESPVTELTPCDGGFRLTTPQGELEASSVVLTTGGQSYPRCGTQGDGYRFATALGHGLVAPLPALVPLVVEAAWVKELRGIAVPAELVPVVGEVSYEACRGPLLFTHQGLSGPSALDASSALIRAVWAAGGYAGGGFAAGKGFLRIDFRTDRDDAQVEAELLAAQKEQGARLVKQALVPHLPTALATALVAEIAQLPADRRLSELSKAERRRVVDAQKRCLLPVSGDRGFGAAEVTSGGIPLEEVDPKTMASRKVRGLYFAGEILDVHGPIGGFNFQAAWSTGFVAGSCA